jgi:hypothetical protein
MIDLDTDFPTLYVMADDFCQSRFPKTKHTRDHRPPCTAVR